MQGDGATAAREASKTEVDLLACMHACVHGGISDESRHVRVHVCICIYLDLAILINNL